MRSDRVVSLFLAALVRWHVVDHFIGQFVLHRAKVLYKRGAGQRWHVVVPAEDLPGSRAYYEVTLAAVRDDDGCVCCAVEMLRDETASLGLQHYLMGESEEQR